MVQPYKCNGGSRYVVAIDCDSPMKFQPLDMQPSQIHQWIDVVLPQTEDAFEKGKKKPKRSARKLEQLDKQKIDKLQQKLILKNEVISELMEENDKAKKLNGDLRKDVGAPMTREMRLSIISSTGTCAAKALKN